MRSYWVGNFTFFFGETLMTRTRISRFAWLVAITSIAITSWQCSPIAVAQITVGATDGSGSNGGGASFTGNFAPNDLSARTLSS